MDGLLQENFEAITLIICHLIFYHYGCQIYRSIPTNDWPD